MLYRGDDVDGLFDIDRLICEVLIEVGHGHIHSGLGVLLEYPSQILSKPSPLVPFPIEISEAEEKRIEEECELQCQDEEMANPVLEQLGILLESEGEVTAEEYEMAKRAVEKARQTVLDAAPTPEERERRAKAWPLQDGKVSWGTQLCC